MAPDLGLVPAAVLSPPEAARKRVALVVAAAAGAAGLAGLWFRFEDGVLFRVVLAVTSALFAWLTMGVALSARDAGRAALRALGISIVLGAASTVIPCIILGIGSGTSSGVGFTAIFIPFGAFFGAIVGFVYGVVIAVAAATTWRNVASGTHDGADRAVRIASVWAILPLLFIGLVVFGQDLNADLSEWATERQRKAYDYAFTLGFVAIGIALNVAAASFWIAMRRLARRRRWLEGVMSGMDPRWGVRQISPRDEIGTLPRLREGFMVLEHRHEHAVYRAAASGEAVAVI